MSHARALVRERERVGTTKLREDRGARIRAKGQGGGLRKAVTFLSETAASRPEIIVSAVGKLGKGSFTDGREVN